MDSGYIVELAGEAAGVLVGAGGVYEFHAVDPRFRSLEGAVFDNGFAAERAVRRLARHGAGKSTQRGRRQYSFFRDGLGLTGRPTIEAFST
ncbi:hypothetical protein ANOBCDAF_02603 [Pleomorphomonas sp. T1.2MG-36]|jgi:hypothetical protein|uniref:hypothetical protein n=1 Tax=Pleomorphomonas sp. T1.2MG-36 TaxID=3041167 RepID=UPI002477B41A|nr:hypothetical protein [Pleomorphomonas sp. T1.2MG-36]CAI9412072.1 hypothetical protein ANOBCDAF_02603 [Pleomorphomonas sp. T1.2MG-36]